MLNKVNRMLCWDVLTKYGVQNQYYKIIEECAELQEAASHMLQGDGDKDNFIEEIVDVLVVCQEFINNEHIPEEEINKIAYQKLIKALG